MTKTSLLIAAVLCTLACRDPLPCPECNEENADAEEEGPLPDLPCGGTDLLTDNLNCGTCGQECSIWYEGSSYEAGSCREGACGPGWAPCQSEGLDPLPNCAQICAGYGYTCVEKGCAGFTALIFAVGFDGDGCHPLDFSPVVTMTGSCEEPIPWLTDVETSREAKCCCLGA